MRMNFVEDHPTGPQGDIHNLWVITMATKKWDWKVMVANYGYNVGPPSDVS